MPTSGLTSAPSELGQFLSTFEQSRRRLREMEAEAAASGGDPNGQDRYLESERSKQLKQLRESVSSCRMQLAQLEREVSLTDSRNGSSGSWSSRSLNHDSPLSGLPVGGKANGSGGGGPSPEEKAYVRRVLDVNNRSFSVDGEVVDFEDPEGDPGDLYHDEFVNSARGSRTAWNHRDLRDVTTLSAAADELSALRSDGVQRGHSARSAADSIDIVEEDGIVVNDVSRSDLDDSHEEWDTAVSDFANRAWGSKRTKRAKKLGKYCLGVCVVLGAIGLAWGLISKGAKSAESVPSSADGGKNVGTSKARFDAIRNRIIQSGVSDEKDLTLLKPDDDAQSSTKSPAPPQYRALHWIVEHDTMGLEVDDPFLLQRYALAAFYYSSSNAQSSTKGNGKGGGDDRADTGRDKTNWLTMRGICAWRGIKCRHRPGTAPESNTYDDNGAVTHLEIPRHRIGGPLIPELFRALKDLRIVDLTENLITGTLSTEIGRLGHLENLKLGKNEIEGTMPSEVGLLTDLQDLDMSENLLGGRIPDEIGGMANLVGLGMYDNVFSGSIPSTLGQLSKLEVLYLDSNELTGSIPSSFYSLKELYDVRLRDNHLSGSVSLDVGEMRKLKLLYLDSNDLTGSIPTHIGQLRELTQLHLFKNQLNGTLPHEVGGLKVLEHFSVNDNALTGPIPEHLNSMQKVRDLYLYGNRLTGTIPEELGGDKLGSVEDFGMAALADLRLFDNELEGTIPSRLGSLVHLEHLSLENNKFTGAVPSELGKLPNLAKLRLDGNDLSGVIPPEVCRLTEEDGGGVLVEFLSDCGGDEPKVACDCCTQCAEPGSGR